MRPGKIVVVGSANADVSVRLDHRPSAGQTVMGSDLAISPGGKGANQAAAAARSGGEVIFVSCVGTDPNADVVLSALRKAGVAVQHVRTGTKPTGVALITITPDGENSIIVASGANDEMCDADVQAVSSILDHSTVVVLQLEIPMGVVKETVKAAARAGCRVVLNAAPARPLDSETLRSADPLVLNKSEAEFYLSRQLGTEIDAQCVLELRGTGASSIVLTLGDRGAVVITPDAHVHVPAPAVEVVVDTTGAGDAFVGAMVVELAAGSDLEQAVRGAVKVASLTVTHEGAQPPAGVAAHNVKVSTK